MGSIWACGSNTTRLREAGGEPLAVSAGCSALRALCWARRTTGAGSTGGKKGGGATDAHQGQRHRRDRPLYSSPEPEPRVPGCRSLDPVRP
jgi:hypothetical protein